MQHITLLGATSATPDFTCTTTYCRGSNAAMSATLVELQKAINQAGVARITVDGLIGESTVKALLRTANFYADKWKGELDPSLESFLIETGQTIVQRAREIVQNAAGLLAALKRGGRLDQGSTSMIQDVANQILATGKPKTASPFSPSKMAALLQTLPVTQPPSTTTTSTSAGTPNPSAQWTGNGNLPPGSGTSAMPPMKTSRTGMWLAIGAAATVITAAGFFAFMRK